MTLRQLVFLLPFLFLGANAAAAERNILNFNPDWRFTKDDLAGAQAPNFDDSAGRSSRRRTPITTSTRSTTGRLPVTAGNRSSGADGRGTGRRSPRRRRGGDARSSSSSKPR